MNIIFYVILSLFQYSWASDLTSSFQKMYESNFNLTKNEVSDFKKVHFVFIPGIMSESFIHGDERARLNFSLITGSYFAQQMKALKKLGLTAERLAASSETVQETRNLILKVLDKPNKKIIFVTHSLGGIALLEQLVLTNELQKEVAGIIFLQSPFFGAPMANVYLDYPYEIDRWLKPLLPFFNTSEETIRYLSVPERTSFMQNYAERISALIQNIPVITAGGVTNNHASTFKASTDIMEIGCVRSVKNRCLTHKLYNGPYDLSDGMVPFNSSKLSGVDFVKLEGADHGETVLKVPFENFKKDKLIYSMLRLLYPKLMRNQHD